MTTSEISDAPWESSVSWRSLGRVDIHCGLPRLPAKIPKGPGLYWLHFLQTDYHYIGQTKRLEGRLKAYRHPTLGTLLEYFVREAHIDNEGAVLYVHAPALGTSDDLSDERKRRDLEKKEISAAYDAKQKLLNRHGRLDVTTDADTRDYIRQLATDACKKLLGDWLK